jgi:hypothetical protein
MRTLPRVKPMRMRAPPISCSAISKGMIVSP